jgi:hypothetical protein
MSTTLIKSTLRFGAALVLTALSLQASAYTVDGNFADWGLQRTGRASDWTPSASVREFIVEDQTGPSNVFLSPGYGGQRYDAEAIYLDWDANWLYVLIVTGLPPNNPHNPAANSYGAGDIAIDFGRDRTWEYGMAVKNYAGLTPGTVYAATAWNYSIWSAPGQLATPSRPATDIVALRSGTALGTGQLVYSAVGINNVGQYASDLHYVIEAALPLSAFGSNWGNGGPLVPFDVQWTMYCANDIITVDPLPAVRVPEPAAPLILAAAAAAFTLRRARVRRAG